MENCSACIHWSYTEHTEEKYGMGVGWCRKRKEPVFCEKTNCLLFYAIARRGE